MMKNVNKWVFALILIAVTVAGCREQKATEEKTEDTIERAGSEAEDGLERAGEEVKEAYKDVKEEVDGATDDN